MVRRVPNNRPGLITIPHPATGEQVPSLVRDKETGEIMNRHVVDIREYVASDPERYEAVNDLEVIRAWLGGAA